MVLLRGHKIKKVNSRWIYADTGQPTEQYWNKKPCGYCGLPFTREGHDGCLGELPGVDMEKSRRHIFNFPAGKRRECADSRGAGFGCPGWEVIKVILKPYRVKYRDYIDEVVWGISELDAAIKCVTEKGWDPDCCPYDEFEVKEWEPSGEQQKCDYQGECPIDCLIDGPCGN